MVVIHFAFVKERKNNIVPHVQSHTYTHTTIITSIPTSIVAKIIEKRRPPQSIFIMFVSLFKQIGPFSMSVTQREVKTENDFISCDYKLC